MPSSLRKSYNDEAAVNVLLHMKYKKSTIAFMKKILDMYKTQNSLQQFLSYASDYKNSGCTEDSKINV